jgi:diguanylate cyclase (GGDEF)-like protein
MNPFSQEIALTDPLTGLPNLRAMEVLLSKELEFHKRSCIPLAFALIEVANLETIERQHLWRAKDRIVVEVARTLLAVTRVNCLLGRADGGRFWIVAHDADFQAANAMTERLRKAVEDTVYKYNDVIVPIQLRVGLVIAENEQNLDEIKDKAVAALLRGP